MTYILKPALRFRSSPNAGFIYDGESGRAYLLNATGTAIVTMLDQHRETNHILSELTHRFEVTSSQAEDDLRKFIINLKTLELLKDE